MYDNSNHTYTHTHTQTHNNPDKEAGRYKNCIRFYGRANSRINSGRCENGNQNKNLLKNNTNQSNTIRIANIINTNGLGKKTYFGNNYTNQRFLTSYLGTTEGQLGGIGTPLRNKF